MQTTLFWYDQTLRPGKTAVCPFENYIDPKTGTWRFIRCNLIRQGDVYYGTVYNRNLISRLSDGFYSCQITFRLSFTHFQSSYPMKNMLALASVFTVFMAVLLVWMDRALANHLEKRALHEMETTMPRPENNLPEIELPEISIRARRGKAAGLQLPEVVITARRCTGA